MVIPNTLNNALKLHASLAFAQILCATTSLASCNRLRGTRSEHPSARVSAQAELAPTVSA